MAVHQGSARFRDLFHIHYQSMLVAMDASSLAFPPKKVFGNRRDAFVIGRAKQLKHYFEVCCRTDAMCM